MSIETIQVITTDGTWEIEALHLGCVPFRRTLLAKGHFDDNDCGRTVIDKSEMERDDLVYLLVEAALNGGLG